MDINTLSTTKIGDSKRIEITSSVALLNLITYPRSSIIREYLNWLCNRTSHIIRQARTQIFRAVFLISILLEGGKQLLVVHIIIHLFYLLLLCIYFFGATKFQ